MEGVMKTLIITLALALTSCVHYEDKSAQQSFTAVLSNIDSVDAGQLHMGGLDQGTPAYAIGGRVVDLARIRGNTEIATTGLRATQSLGNKAIQAIK